MPKPKARIRKGTRKRLVKIDTASLREVKKAKEVKRAFMGSLEYWGRRQKVASTKYWPSHGIHHANSVAKHALRAMDKMGVTDKVARENMVIASIYHDIYRPTDVISGREYNVKSADIAFRQLGFISEKRRNEISKIILGKHEHSKFLDYADLVELTSKRAVLFGRGENPFLREIHPSKSIMRMEELYQSKFETLPLKLRVEIRKNHPLSEALQTMGLDRQSLPAGMDYAIMTKKEWKSFLKTKEGKKTLAKNKKLIDSIAKSESESSARVLWTYLKLHPELEEQMPEVFGGAKKSSDLEAPLNSLGRYEEVKKGVRKTPRRIAVTLKALVSKKLFKKKPRARST